MLNNEKLIKELFEAKVHLGHKKNRIHPKARKYIYTIQNGVSIIDLTKTVDLLEKAEKFAEELSKQKKTLLLVCTKRIAALPIQSLCKKANIIHVTTKWPAGLITNFATLTKNIRKLETFRKEKEEGVWKKLVKHERIKQEKELTKLERNYGGLTELKNLPDVLFIIDAKKEKNAVIEAQKQKIPIIAMTDTNVDPSIVDYPIPANDDSLSSVELITKKIIDAYRKAGKK